MVKENQKTLSEALPFSFEIIPDEALVPNDNIAYKAVFVVNENLKETLKAGITREKLNEDLRKDQTIDMFSDKRYVSVVDANRKQVARFRVSYFEFEDEKYMSKSTLAYQVAFILNSKFGKKAAKQLVSIQVADSVVLCQVS